MWPDPNNRSEIVEALAIIAESEKENGELREDQRAEQERLAARLAAIDLERIKRNAQNPDMCEGPTGPDGAAATSSGDRSKGLRAIERNSNVISTEGADRLDKLLRTDDPNGVAARYLDAVGDPAYNSGFGKVLMDPVHGHLRHTPEEVAAFRRVTTVEAEQRALGVTTGSAGGFALPIAIDPSILLSSNGVLNPIRQLSTVETISTNEWRGVSSDGVTASFAAEATETTDNSPTLVQPTIITRKAQCFVPFSIEVGEDWGSLQQELARLFSDAKDVLEATVFLTGVAASNQPIGILGSTGGLTTTQRVQTAVAATFAVGDPWLLKAGLPARFTGNASVVANPAILDKVFRFTGGNSAEPPIMPTREGPCFGKPAYELSTMVSTTTTGSKIMLAGDFKAGYRIADRIGGQVEIIPHLFGAAQRPTGQRGAYFYFRVGAAPQVLNALRYLEVL